MKQKIMIGGEIKHALSAGQERYRKMEMPSESTCIQDDDAFTPPRVQEIIVRSPDLSTNSIKSSQLRSLPHKFSIIY
jgi:hypothetical protein